MSACLIFSMGFQNIQKKIVKTSNFFRSFSYNDLTLFGHLAIIFKGQYCYRKYLFQ